MKRGTMATALHTCCAERTRAMQLVCMCASYICTPYYMDISVKDERRVQIC